MAQVKAPIKKFNKKQLPIAIASLVLVVVAMVCILVFGKSTKPDVKPESSDTTVVTSEKDKNKKVTTTAKTTTGETTKAVTIAPPDDGYTMQNSIMIKGDRAMEVYYVAEKSLTNYATTINSFAARVPNVKVHVILAPTSIAFYGPESYRTGSHSQSKGISIAYKALSGSNIQSVDAFSELSKHTGEYIYFRTDHHWTARGAYYAYYAFCKANGLTPSPLESYQTGKIEGFVGSMYTYTSAEVLKNNPDYVEYFKPHSDATGTIYSNASMTDGREMTIINENVTGKNKYLAFLQGDNPVEKIVTSNKNGKKVIVIKESYGNAFAPFLIDNFEEVYVLDPRRGDVNLKSFVDANGITDVIFINYTFVPSNPTYKKAFTQMLS